MNTITVIVPGVCSECGCKVTPKNVGFECDSFLTCRKCYNKEENDYQDFLTDLTPEF